jgi:hypothetical protein
MVRYAESRVLFFTTSLSVAAMSLPDPDQAFREWRIAMSQSASADEGKAVRERTTPARDPKIAVQEEYEIARQRGTAQALELFISRQPDTTH